MKRDESKRSSISREIAADEAKWNEEVRNLKKISVMLWHDLQSVESVFCLDINKRINFFEEVRKFEIGIIKRALLQTGGNQKKTAKLLEITTSNLNSKIKRYGISISRSIDKAVIAD